MNVNRDSILHTTINIIGSLLPLILSFFAILMFSEQPLSIPSIIGNGEISIICVPIAISVLFGLFSISNLRSSNKFSFIYWVTLLFLILGTFFYAMQYQNSVDAMGDLINQLEIEIMESQLEESGAQASEKATSKSELALNIKSLVLKSSSEWNLSLMIFSLIFLGWITWATYQAKLVEINPDALTSKRKSDVDSLDDEVKKRK